MEITKINNTNSTINYIVEKNIINFRNGELTLDLSKYERDFDVTIDVTENQYSMLQTGLSKSYVAQILIPARTYTETIENEGTEEEDIQKIANEFDITKCELKLWEVK